MCNASEKIFIPRNISRTRSLSDLNEVNRVACVDCGGAVCNKRPSEQLIDKDGFCKGENKNGILCRNRNRRILKRSNSEIDLCCYNVDEIIMKQENSLPDELTCAICLEMLWKPILLQCGHLFCFWCTYSSMNMQGVSLCPLCKHPYNNFQRIFRPIFYIIAKHSPALYVKRYMSIKNCERTKNCESPSLQNIFNIGNPIASDSIDPKFKSLLSYITAYDSNLSINFDDCNENDLIKHPSSVIVDRSNEMKASNSTDNTCNSEYSTSNILENMRNEFIHIGVGCDCCGKFPIVGRRYKCDECTDEGYDLCHSCYASGYNGHGRFDERHSQWHTLSEVCLNSYDAELITYNRIRRRFPVLTHDQVCYLFHASVDYD